MEIDRDALIKLLGAFVDASEVLQRELMLRQMLFAAACKTKGLDEKQIEDAVDRARVAMAEKINAACQADYQNLLEKLPQIIDLLASDQDAALRFLKEWTPKGSPS
jgi:hypothetical protein